MYASVIFLIFCTSAYAEDIIVDLPKYGSVKGARAKSRSGIEYFAFRGVQYAKAPTGDLRFRDPEDPDRWGAREAKDFANVCPQVNFLDPKKVSGDENCLYLNVYTSQLNQDAELLPVLLWIHGGGFVAGGGGTYGPDYLMDKPLVLVTFNYRLNALGFMHFDDKFLPGNYGMKDQVKVLEWVQEHIKLFGGDPTRVTLAGSSSGAASVNWHMYSPKSKKLFHRAILQSGTAKSVWAAIPKHVAQKRASAIATMAGCVFKSVEENVNCLRDIPTEELVQIQTRFEIWKGNPFFFGVVIESPDSEKPFITVSPWNSSPHTENMHLMIGFTADEGGFTAMGLLRNQGAAIEELGQKYKRLFPILMLYQFNVGLESRKAVFGATDKIRDHYFDRVEINKSTFPRIKNMLADSQIIYDSVVTIKEYEFPTYFYQYSHKNEHTFAELEKPNFLDASGPVHSDDMISLFKLETIFPDAKDLNEADLKVSKLMIDLWANFITNGDPNIDNNNQLKWNPVQNKLYFYSINVEPTIEEFSWENYSFWKDLGWHSEI